MSRFGPRRELDDGALRELAGDLDGALHVYLRDARHDDACRVTMLLADREPSPRARVAWLARAGPIAGGSPALRARYAEARLDLGEEDPSSLLPSEAAALARELDALGVHAAAARAFRLAAMHDDEAASWARAGDLDRTEAAHARGLSEARDARALDAARSTFELLERSGQRVAAIALADATPHAPELAARADALRANLTKWPRLRARIGGADALWLLGDRVVVGRVGADLDVRSPSVSRQHLAFSRGPSGEILATDLGSANGTHVAGARVAAPLAVLGPMALRLGADAELRAEPVDGGLRVRHGTDSAWLPLGPARVGGCILARASDHLRLLPAGGGPPRLRGIAAPEGVDLCVGDVVTCGAVVVEVALA